MDQITIAIHARQLTFLLAQGIGRATALAYARAGVAAIAIADIKNSQILEVAAEARKIATNKNFQAVSIQTDVTSEESVTKMVGKAVSAFGRIDYALNIAGVSTRSGYSSEGGSIDR